MHNLKFVRTHPDAVVPRRAHHSDAGLDLSSVEDLVIRPGEHKLVRTGIAVSIPDGMAGLVVPRSGLALKCGVTVLNSPGLIDSGYRGEVKMMLVNHGPAVWRCHKNDRIAQLVLVPVWQGGMVEVESLDATERGAGGFGSTGV